MRISNIIVLGILGTSSAAFAQNGDDFEYSLPSRDADKPLEEGAFMPFATTPAANGNRGSTFVSYNSATDAARVDAMAQVRIVPLLQLNVGLDYDQEDTDPSVALQFDVMRQRSSMMDLQLAAGWDKEGINDVSAVFAEVAAGRNYGTNYVFGSARADFGTGGDEAGLRLGAAAVRPIGGNFVAGIDSRLDIDLERDDVEPMHEAGWALQAGPVLGYSNDMIALTASIGVATNEPRATENTEVGAYGGAGLGLAF